MVTDFSSADYWSTRFQKEKSFEWLSGSDAIGSIVLDLVKEISRSRASPGRGTPQPVSQADGTGEVGPGPLNANGDPSARPVHILHFGCGTSSLGPDLARLLYSANLPAQVIDADYVSDSITSLRFTPSSSFIRDPRSEREVPLIHLDVLDRVQLAATAPEGGWDLLVDKSTADAISCGPSLPRREVPGGAEQEREGEEEEMVEPIHILCANLAEVTRIGGRWLCVSYSATRFDHLRPTSVAEGDSGQAEAERGGMGGSGWRLVSKLPLEGAFRDPAAAPGTEDGGRVVYTPETNVWAYVLERV